MIVHFYKFAAKSVQKRNFRKNEIIRVDTVGGFYVPDLKFQGVN